MNSERSIERTIGRSGGNGGNGNTDDSVRLEIVELLYAIQNRSDGNRSWMCSVCDGGGTGRLRLWELDERRGNERRLVLGTDGGDERGGNCGEHSGTETMFQRRNIGVMP